MTASRPAQLRIVVVRGGSVGSSLPLTEQPRVIGRGVDVDLALQDRRISRRHLEVYAKDGIAFVRICSGAVAFLVDGEPREAYEARAGDRIVVGETVLAVVDARDAPTPGSRDETAATDVRTLLTGVSADVRGLADVYALGEALEAARERADVDRVVDEWGRRHLGARDGKVITADDAEIDPELAPHLARAGDVMVEARAGGSLVTAPAYGERPGMIAFRVDAAPDAFGPHLRRLVAVAGRVCAMSIARVRDATTVEHDRQSLRQQAVGSARAFLGDSPAARQIAKLVPRLAASDASVLIAGETGVGKTFVARLIHESGPRAHEPLRVLNCAAIPENLLEAELFGHERGAFTGATASRAGAFESAGAGTILLDEIAELPLTSQAKLLRVLEDKRFERLGSNRELPLRARVLAATNRDLKEMADAGRFRSDLFFRLSVITVLVPPLRDRGDDLRELARHILADLSATSGRRVRDFTPAAMDAIVRYAWPGNVRELRNAIERAVVLGDGPLVEAADLPDLVVGATSAAQPEDPELVRLPATLAVLEARAIEAALRATGGNRTHAAALLGIHRMTLVKKLKTDD